MPSDTSAVPEEGPDESLSAARTWRLLSVLLALVLVACLVVAFLLWRDRADLQDDVDAAEQQDQAADAAEAAARQFATQLTTYSPSTVDSMCERVEEAATSDYLEGGQGLCSAESLQLVKESQAVAEGAVLNAAAKPVEGGKVEVLLFTDQEVTGRAKTDCFLEETRLVLTMTEQDGRWLVDHMEIMNYLAGQNRLPCEKAG